LVPHRFPLVSHKSLPHEAGATRIPSPSSHATYWTNEGSAPGLEARPTEESDKACHGATGLVASGTLDLYGFTSPGKRLRFQGRHSPRPVRGIAAPTRIGATATGLATECPVSVGQDYIR